MSRGGGGGGSQYFLIFCNFAISRIFSHSVALFSCGSKNWMITSAAFSSCFHGDIEGRLRCCAPAAQYPPDRNPPHPCISVIPTSTAYCSQGPQGAFGLWAYLPCPMGLRGPRIASSGESQAEAHRTQPLTTGSGGRGYTGYVRIYEYM